MITQPQYITNTEGKKIAVILPLADYQELMEDLEDLEDLAAIVDRKNEVSIPFEATQ